MSQLYFDDHQNCDDFADSRQAAFSVSRFREGEKLPDKRMEHTVVFLLLEGKLLVDCGPFLGCEVCSDFLLLIPNGTAVSGKAMEDTLVLRCVLNMDGNFCSRCSFEMLKKYVDEEALEYRCDLLPVRKRLREFASFLVQCLDDGLGCRHFHDCKQNELMLMLRGYYTNEELARFFYPILSKDWDINNFVWSHYKKASNVSELAKMAHLSLVTFNRHFKKAFGESAARWLEKRRAEDVLREIRLTKKSFSEIAMELCFSSPAYLTTFCKRFFGKTPKELREGSKQQ